MSPRKQLYRLSAIVVFAGVTLPAIPASDNTSLAPPTGIVDCLLPGEIRRIGGSIYQMPQRPERLLAGECTIRGGDFLLFDRANYDTSLAHWIAEAERSEDNGDAMLYVGEIYARGLGRDPDFTQAAIWFHKAVDAGNTTAMISLAHLYKTGQGVPIDLKKSQALYTQAFGSDIVVPLDPTAVAGVDQRVQTLLAEVENVRRDKAAVEAKLRAAVAQQDSAERALADAVTGDHAAVELQATVDALEKELAARQSIIESINTDNAELKNLRQELAEQRLEANRLENMLAQARSEVTQGQTELDSRRSTLTRKQGEFNELLTDADANREALLESSKLLESYRASVAELELSLKKAQDERDLYEALANDATTKESRIAMLTATIARLERDVEAAQSESLGVEAKLSDSRGRLENEIAELRRKGEMSDAEIVEQEAELGRLRAAVTRAEQETGRHLAEIDRLSEQSDELVALRNDLEREQAQSDRLRQLLADSQARVDASDSRAGELHETQERLQVEIARLRTTAAGASVLAQREHELASAQSELAALDKKRAAEQAEFARYREQMSATAERQNEAIANLRASVKATRVEREQIAAQLDGASKQLGHALSDLERQKKHYEALQDELRDARAGRRDDQASLETLQAQLDSQNQQLAELNNEVARVQEERDRYAQTLKDQEAEGQAGEVMFVGPTIVLTEPSEGLLEQTKREVATRGDGEMRAISVVAAGRPGETRTIRGHVNAPAGLASLSINGMMVMFDSNNTNAFTQTIEVQEQMGVRIAARDAQGNEAVKEFGYSTVAAPKVQSSRNKFASALLDGLRYHALIIANEDYETLTDLKTPIADAKAIGKVLEERYGFKVEYLFNADKETLADTVERALYRDQKDKRKDNDKDAILVYYAGHGFTSSFGGPGKYYWAPVNARRESPNTWYETINVSQYLRDSSIAQVMIIADSCYAGKLPSRDGMFDNPEPKHSPLYIRHVEKRARKMSRFVFTSGGLEPVLDGGGDGHSVFARSFLDVLRENNELLPGWELQERVAPRVEHASAMAGKEQTPYFGYLSAAGHEFGEFYLRAPRAAQASNRTQPAESFETLALLQPR